ncbi:helix-turn-helix domain-containing protein [Laribacter hongkongensis]|uniref:helix-turn-helix transcriptional regulator n=1 Tax=Laribacter hongkongensis TaxID=168471 RepID=UPI001EFCA72C|nr:helix-turn-helix transcriptional regulator [Laribacter hongkongensis]MCG9116993.1 helix-turn-helix domain-containing protein [Laribacter hongkongensis]
MTIAISTATELGATIRATRLAMGKTQVQLAEQIGCRRQTIGDLEAGRNVEVYTLMYVLAALGKGLRIVDPSPELEELAYLFREDED